jgi:hypothetical protein
VALGGVEPLAGEASQARLKTDLVMERPLRFLFKEAVERNPDEPAPSGPISLRDTKTRLTFVVEGEDSGGRCVYTVRAEGDAERPEMRIRAVVGGYMRYSQCQRVEWNQFIFPDGGRYDEFARLLLPYARNVSAADTMLAAADLEGQMTTQTLGFSQT